MFAHFLAVKAVLPRFAFLLFSFLLGSGSPVLAQYRWLATPAFPNGPKTGLTHTGDSTLFTLVDAGILGTRNQGRTWKVVLRTPGVHSLYTTRAGLVLAGGTGKVYRSFNSGRSWDSVAVASPHPVAEFVETPAGDLLAATGTLDFTLGFVGSGVFLSADNGQTWAVRNTGLGAGLYVNHLAVARNGRLFLSVADDEAWKKPGLYVSDNNGREWKHLALHIDGRGVIDNNLVAYQVTSLAVSPQDTLLCSFEGVATNVAVRFNLKRSLNDITAPSPWEVSYTSNTGMWWMSQQLNSIHFAQNGDWFSSFSGSQTTGATLVSHDRGRSWAREQQGVGLNWFGQRSAQHFTETSAGRVFMVQNEDPQVYHTDTRTPTAVTPRAALAVQLFPNPAGSLVRVLAPGSRPVASASLQTLSGQLIATTRPAPGTSELSLDLTQVQPGAYLVSVALTDGRVIRQRLVKQ